MEALERAVLSAYKDAGLQPIGITDVTRATGFYPGRKTEKGWRYRNWIADATLRWLEDEGTVRKISQERGAPFELTEQGRLKIDSMR